MNSLPFSLVKPTVQDVRRYAGYTLVRGEVIPSAPTTVQVTCVITPVIRTSNLTFLPESASTKKVVRIFSVEELRQQEEKGKVWSADQFTWQGEDYIVIKVAPWNVNNFSGYESYAYKKDVENVHG